MSNAGVFLVGLLLLGHGGIYLIARRLLSRPAAMDTVMPAPPESHRPLLEEDDLDSLLDDLEA